MGYSSQPGQVGFGLQSQQGTAVAATRFARLRSGSLGGNRELLIPDPEIGGNRDIPGAYLGAVSYAGDFEVYWRMQVLALLAKAALGAGTSSATSGTDEVQTITITGTPTGGTFKLYFRGGTTGALNWNATAAEVQSALRSLPAIYPTGVDVTGLVGGPFTVTFAGDLADTNPPLIEKRDVALTGGTAPNVTITTATPGVPIIGTHVLTPADNSLWLTVEERISNEFDSYRYTDVKVNTLRLEAEAQGYLMGSVSLVGLHQEAGFADQAAPDWDTTPMMVGGQITVEFGGNVLPARSFTFEVNNNIETDDFTLGSLELNSLTDKRREVRMGMSYRPQDSDLWRAAMYGDPNATVPQAGPAYTGSVKITGTSFETIGNVVGGTPYSFVIEAPYVAITPFKITPSGDDAITNDLELVLLRPDPYVPLFTMTIVNDLATVS